MTDTRVSAPEHLVPFRDALRWWLKLGFINFGGPAGQIAVMHDELVERRRWISNRRFVHAMNFCVLLPGPEAQQLAIYIGWLLNGTAGGIVAGILFVLPAFFLILGLSWTYAVHGDISWVAALFYGLQSAVVGLVAVALLRVGSRALRGPVAIALAAGAFVATFFFKIAFPLVVLAAGVVGWAARNSRHAPLAADDPNNDDPSLVGDSEGPARSRTPGRTARVLLVGLLVWWVPLLMLIALRGGDDTLSREALFFSQAAMVTFGGAYAVLAYINEAAVNTYGWLEPGQMAAGLGLAESTPGPLIMVTEFVGFLGAYRFPGGLDPVVAGVLGAVVTTWATFAPCFLWIFLGAPYIERLRGNKALGAVLAAVTAAVVGLILNLAVSLGLTAMFDRLDLVRSAGATFPSPDLASVDPFAVVVALGAFIALWRYRVNVVWVVVASAVAGLLYRSFV